MIHGIQNTSSHLFIYLFTSQVCVQVLSLGFRNRIKSNNYRVGRDGDKAANVKSIRVDGHGQPPMKIGVVRSRDHVDTGHVLVHRS